MCNFAVALRSPLPWICCSGLSRSENTTFVGRLQRNRRRSSALTRSSAGTQVFPKCSAETNNLHKERCIDESTLSEIGSRKKLASFLAALQRHAVPYHRAKEKTRGDCEQGTRLWACIRYGTIDSPPSQWFFITVHLFHCMMLSATRPAQFMYYVKQSIHINWKQIMNSDVSWLVLRKNWRRGHQVDAFGQFPTPASFPTNTRRQEHCTKGILLGKHSASSASSLWKKYKSFI